MHTCMHIFVYAQLCTHTRIYVCIHTHTYIYIYIYTYTYLYKLIKGIYIYIFFFQEWDIENYYYEHNGDNSFLQQINYSKRSMLNI